jgi:hypothetical protein
MPQPEHEPPAAAQPPRADGQGVATAVALLEAAALTAAMRRVASWNRACTCPRRPIGCGYRQRAAIKRAGGPTRASTRPNSVWRCWLRRLRSAGAWPRTDTSALGSCRLTCAMLRLGLRLALGSAASQGRTAGAWSRPDSGSAGRPSCDDLPYHLKAGPAGGRLRRPSSRRQRHDGHRGAGLTLHMG